jgi:ABC-type proline/glycine betaine transport system permease subunit
MRTLDTLTPELSRAAERLASKFHQHVTIALTACLLALLLG